MTIARGISVTTLVWAALFLSGCSQMSGLHKRTATPPPPTIETGPLSPQQVAEPPPVHPGPPPGSEMEAETAPAPAEETPKPAPHHRRVKPSPSTAADQPATDAKTPDTTATAKNDAAATDSPIGQLTAGDTPDAGAERQRASDLIEANDRRLRTMRRGLSGEEQHTIAQVKKFQQQARQALGGGDMHAAQTLATKAKLLLDELLK